MICPKCNFQNPKGISICQSCGVSLLRKKNWWKIGFLVELGIIIPFSLIFIIGSILVKNNNTQMKVTEKETAGNSPPENLVSNEEKIAYPKIESWKTYTNPELGVTFQYPDDWVLFNEPDKEGVSTGFSVAVSLDDEKCGEKNDQSECESYGFYIERDDPYSQPLPTENANLYTLELILEEEKRLDKCMRDTNTWCSGERAIPGLAYLGKDERLFSEQILFPAAEISTMPRMKGSRYQYYIINNKRLYLIEVLVPDSQTAANKPWFIDKNHPIIKIIKTLKFL